MNYPLIDPFKDLGPNIKITDCPKDKGILTNNFVVIENKEKDIKEPTGEDLIIIESKKLIREKLPINEEEQQKERNKNRVNSKKIENSRKILNSLENYKNPKNENVYINNFNNNKIILNNNPTLIENVTTDHTNNIDTKTNSITTKNFSTKRFDSKGIPIIKGLKKHRVSFVDFSNSKRKMIEVIPVESFKKYNIQNSYGAGNETNKKINKKDETTSCCFVF